MCYSMSPQSHRRVCSNFHQYIFFNIIKETLCNKLEITIARKCCLKGTDWKLAFGGRFGEIRKMLASVQSSYIRNIYNDVL